MTPPGAGSALAKAPDGLESVIPVCMGVVGLVGGQDSYAANQRRLRRDQHVCLGAGGSTPTGPEESNDEKLATDSGQRRLSMCHEKSSSIWSLRHP
jgi:hypothetical protein